MAHSIETHLKSATAIKIAEDNGVDVLHVSEFDDMMLYEISTVEYGVQSDVEYSLEASHSERAHHRHHKRNQARKASSSCRPLHPHLAAITHRREKMISTYTQAEFDEAYEIGKRDGYEEAVQDIDQKTGGDGEYRVCLGDADPDRHTPDAAAMIQRIVDRFEVLNLLDDAAKTGRDQPDD